MKPTTDAALGVLDHRRLHKKVIRVLIAGQILGGLGMGASLALGALLIMELSGSSAWSGMAATMSTLGAALLAVPLARLAQVKGRRVSLSTGALIAASGAALTIIAAVLSSFPVVIMGLGLLGAGYALNLQSRFAATDLAHDSNRARDLSLVVWSTMIGAVAGPNLFEPGESVGRLMGLPPFSGGFVIALVAQLLGALVYWWGLRPDPLHAAAAANKAAGTATSTSTSGLSLLKSSLRARRAVSTLSLSHAMMVALMSMTPVHLTNHDASLTVIGLTLSMHVAGMYALSPLFGWLADRISRRAVILGGQVLFALSLVLAWLGSETPALVLASLILLGLGWSASIVAGSALVAEAVPAPEQPKLQGLSDLLMNLAGAAGGALAGPVFVAIGFNGLSASLFALVGIVIFLHWRKAPVEKPSQAQVVVGDVGLAAEPAVTDA